jgi:hypothetical protein
MGNRPKLAGYWCLWVEKEKEKEKEKRKRERRRRKREISLIPQPVDFTRMCLHLSHWPAHVVVTAAGFLAYMKLLA